MAFVVIYDACVLYPAPLRDLLIRIARTGVVRARWSTMILDECFENILAQRADLSREQLARTRELMVQAVPDCIVDGHDDLASALDLPDPDDRHVLAAAIRAGARSIVTFNLKDFPADALDPHLIEAIHPDDFVLNQLELRPYEALAAVKKMRARLTRPPRSAAELIATLERSGLPASAAHLRQAQALI
jgi:predicted nucleic acid-binding protein